LHRHRHARIARHRCLVRGACDRMWLRVDHARSRLRALPRIEVAGAGRFGGVEESALGDVNGTLRLRVRGKLEMHVPTPSSKRLRFKHDRAVAVGIGYLGSFIDATTQISAFVNLKVTKCGS